MKCQELPSKDSELNADFLIQFVKIDKRDAEEVAKILSDKKVRVVETLLTWETKDVLFEKLFKSNEDFYGIAGLLWNFILKYHPERAKSTGSQMINEITPLPLNDVSPTGFLARLIKKNRSFVPREFFGLEERLWGDSLELNFIFVREWYPGGAERILREFASLNRRSVIVAGNKGTGKTVFGIFLVVQALRGGFIVIYETAREKIWIVGNGDSTRNYSDVEECFNRWNVKPALQPGVYSLDGLDYRRFTNFAQCRSVIHIVDVGDSYTAEIDPNGPKVIISSPNFDKLKRIDELRKASYCYLPLWSWDEIELFNNKLPSPNENLLYARRDPEDLRLMFDTFGGIPRTY